MDKDALKSKLQEVLTLIKEDIGGIRTGRATPALVENLEVPVYGGSDKLKVVELGTISASDSQTIVIDPWDKSIIGEIRQGIQAANIGMNPSIDGEIIRITLPALTTEDREKYVKLLSTKLENGKVMIRQIRTQEMQKIKEGHDQKQISEDEAKRQEKEVQQIIDDFNHKLEEMGEQKKKELMSL